MQHIVHKCINKDLPGDKLLKAGYYWSASVPTFVVVISKAHIPISPGGLELHS